MRKILGLLLLITGILSQTNTLFPQYYNRVVTTGNLINRYDHCRVLRTPERSDIGGIALFWTVNNAANTFHGAINARTNGYVGFGVSLNNGTGHLTNLMIQADVVLALRNGTTLDVGDYYNSAQDSCISTLGTLNGVCKDTAVAANGQSNVAGNLTSNATLTMQTFEFFRPLRTGDPSGKDADIRQGVQLYIWSYGLNYNLIYHLSRGYDFFDVYSASVACTDDCGVQGTCVKGCCVCNAGWFGRNCNVSQANLPDDGTGGGGPVGALTPNIVDAEYQFTSVLDGALTLFWNVDLETEIISFGLRANSPGFIGFGLSGDGNMVGSDVILGWVDDATQQVVVNDYFLSAQSGCTSGSGVCKDVDVGGTNDVLEFNGNQNGGVTELKWTRKLKTSDAKDREYAQGNLKGVWAYGTTDSDQIRHSNRASIDINLLTGAVSTDKTQQRKTVAHGLLMFFGWGLLNPIASFIGRFLKRFKWWFNVHRLLQSLAMLLVLIGFILAVDFNTVHLDTFHKILGLIIVILGLAQPVIGTLADKWFDPERKGIPIFPDKTHWVIGWGTFLAAIVNIAVGINEYKDNFNTSDATGLLIAYIVYGCLTAVLILIYGIYAFVANKGGH